jgi:TonB-linked SusC/RagA family outer membrane protein
MEGIDANDIESVEIVKGAAAASLYGTRAANGVVQITTQRGRNVADNSVRYTIRSEIGSSDLPGQFNLTQRHHFRMTEDGTQFVQSNGEACDWLTCDNVALAGQRSLGESAGLWNTIQREQWPGQTYDHVDRFFDPGTHMTNSVSASGRSGATNYHLSFSRVQEDGVMEGHGGQERNSFRVNVDQSMREDLTVSAMASYTVRKEDWREGNLFQLTRMPAGIDIASPDPNYPEFYVLKPDQNNDNANPLNSMRAPTIVRDRNRFLGSVNATWSPLSWFDLEGQVALDRLDRNDSSHTPRGVRNLNAVPGIGSIMRHHRRIQGMNTAVTGTARHRFGDLGVVTSVLYLFEREDEWRVTAESEEFIAEGVFSIDNTPVERRDGASLFLPERRDGFFVNTQFDYQGRYFLDALVRQDGNSRFGPDSRRAWYYRVGGTYRIAEEPWFNLPGIDDVGLKYSIGTAGNAPNFAGQFETYDVDGVILPGALGNRNLKPEVVTEQEMGIDLLFGRFSLDLVYARSRTEDALLQVPLLAYRGFSTQWQNAAAMKSNTIEASLHAQVMRTPTFSWSTRLLFDRTRQKVTSMTVPPFQQGISQQGLNSVFLVREGEALGTFYGFQFAEHCGHLPSGVDCNQFQVNDDGLLVWVGDAGSWRNGWDTHTNANGDATHWWGTAAPFTIRGEQLLWGQPFQAEDTDPLTGERTTFLPLGNTTPDYTLAWSNTLTWRGFTLYGLLRSVQGYHVYNQPLQWATFQNYSGIMDQSGQPQEVQKPLGYYAEVYGLSGLAPSSRFVEDASFVKLRELALSYRLGAPQLAAIGLRGVSGATLSVIGRNLFTWTDYDGYDPEVGRAGGTTGSAALARVDGYNYPNFRTFTFGVQVDF